MIIAVKEDIVTYCRYVLDNPYEFAIIDTETTGFINNEVIDVAIIDPTGAVLYNGLFKPKHAIESSAQAVHHIGGAMVANAPLFSEEWSKIYLEAISGRTLIAYNAVFDKKCMEATVRMHRITGWTSWPSTQWQCIMMSYASYFDAPPKYPDRPEPAWQKLQYACQQQGIDIGQQEHRALSDTLATLALMKRIANLGSATKKYCKTPEPWETMASIEDLLSPHRPQRQETALKLVNTSQSIDEITSSVSSLSAKSENLGTCSKCKAKAIMASPSNDPQSVYCQQHGQSKCGVHTIEDFVYCNIRNTWLCPCIANKEVIESKKEPLQQSLLLVS